MQPSPRLPPPLLQSPLLYLYTVNGVDKRRQTKQWDGAYSPAEIIDQIYLRLLFQLHF